ncbi:RDD family protein [Mycolicibacterium aubagnense]
MTVGQETTNAESVSDESGRAETAVQAAPVLASWPARAGAFALDVVLGVAVIVVMALLGYAARADWTLWVYAGLATLAVAAILVNRWLLPSITGWSLGRSLFSIRVERVPAGVPAGMGRLILRDLAHLLDTVAVLLGWLWPLWDPRHRTFAEFVAAQGSSRCTGSEAGPRPPGGPGAHGRGADLCGGSGPELRRAVPARPRG